MNKFLVFCFFFFFSFKVFPQTASQPLELPNFIIEGKEQIDVQVGTKQIPSFSTYLDRKTIDSMIIVGRPRNYVIFPISFPNTIISKKFPDGFVIGSFGSHLTANISAGYKTAYQGYEISPFANFGLSKGHVENSNYTKLSLSVQTDYLAPDKFYIFGGSKTTTSIGFDFKNYKLYALSNPPQRNQIIFDGKIKSIGFFEGYDFVVGAALNSSNQTGTGKDIGESTLGGFLEIKEAKINHYFGGKISVDIRSFDNSSAHFFEASGFSKFDLDNIKIAPVLGIQIAKSSSGKSRPMVVVSATLQSQLHPDFILEGKISNRLKNISFGDFLKLNPYLSDSLIVDYSNTSEIHGKLKYQPNKDLTFVIGTNLALNKRLPVFNVAKFGYFDVQYIDATLFSIAFEGFWTNSIVGTFSSIFNITVSSQNLNKNEVPNTPTIKIRTDYSRNFFDKLNFGAFFEYVGKRFADIDNKISLSNYNNLGLSLDYLLNKNIIFKINVENLLNSNIVNWYGYKEWGFNFKVGLTYKF